jgi:hypothetical protein
MNAQKYAVVLGGFLSMSAALLFLAGSALASSPSETVIYNFSSDYSTPVFNFVADSAGNLYGPGASGNDAAYGFIFKLSHTSGSWKQTILFTFNGTNGNAPSTALVLDSKGNLYGATSQGGTGDCKEGNQVVGCGVVFELSPPSSGDIWTETILHNFAGGSDGIYPNGNLVFDSAGNLYGTTWFGGNSSNCTGAWEGCGTAFRLKPPAKSGGAWTETVLAKFNNTDGSYPNSLVFEKSGLFYGTASSGGTENAGVFFELQGSGSKWTETVLYNFLGGSNAGGPASLVTQGSNLFGVSYDGEYKYGTIFELTPSASGTWTESVVYDFTGGADGVSPNPAITFDSSGNLYSTTYFGGLTSECNWTGPGGCGVVYKLTPSANETAWTQSVLYTFNDTGTDNNLPSAGVIFGKGGLLYGSTAYGGTATCDSEKGGNVGCGTVYKMSP